MCSCLVVSEIIPQQENNVNTFLKKILKFKKTQKGEYLIMRIKRNDKVNVSISHYIQIYTDECKLRLTTKTVNNYIDSLNKFINTVNIDTVNDININTVNKFISNTKNDLSVASVNHYLRDIRAFVNWLYDNGYIPNKVPVRLLKGQTEKQCNYTLEQIKCLIKPPIESDSFTTYRSYVIICFILSTGARSATLREIQIHDVDFEYREIYYRHTKNKHFQIVPMSDKLKRVLKEYISLYRYDAKESDYLFCDVYGNKLSETALKNSIRRYNLSKGVANCSIHALRHTFARNYLLQGGNIFKLQQILGHKSIELTRQYVYLLSDDLKQDIDKLSTLDSLAIERHHQIKRKEI